MLGFPELTKREREVLQLLLQGKSNKMIALALGISVRTVEFHLTNIYTKAQVRSRVELILKLGDSTGQQFLENLGTSTVANKDPFLENKTTSARWHQHFRMGVSTLAKELDMKKIVHLLVGPITAILLGLFWVGLLEHTIGLATEDFVIFKIPFFLGLVLIGVVIGNTGARRHKSDWRVLCSVLLGAGLSPVTILPIMRFIVIPLGEMVGLFNTAAIPDNIESNIAMGIMLTLWFALSMLFGLQLLSAKPRFFFTQQNLVETATDNQ